MKKAGYVQINKKARDVKGRIIGGSKFADHWKEYVR